MLASSLAAFAGAHAADKKDKAKPAANQIIDSGSFGVFVRGQRVATETFHIEQENGNIIIKSQLKETAGGDSEQPEVGLANDLERRVAALRMEPVVWWFADRISGK